MKGLYHKVIGNPFTEKLLFRETDNKPGEIYFAEIDPFQVKYISLLPSRPFFLDETARKGVVSGLWDHVRQNSSNDFPYRTAQQLAGGLRSEDTVKYKKARKTLSHKKALGQTETFFVLIEQISRAGYLSQYELGDHEKKTRALGEYQIPSNEMVVGLARNGGYIRLAGGRHRLGIVRCLGIRKIPVILSLIHGKASGKLPDKRRVITGNPEDYRPF